MNKRLLLSLMGMLVCMMTFAITTPETGKYYKIVNQNPDKSITTEGTKRGYVMQEDKITHKLKAVEPGSNTIYQQIWKCMGTGKFQNALTKRYIGPASRSVQVETVQTATTISMTNKGSYYILSQSMQLHADGSNNIVGWNDENNQSNWWDFEEVTDVDADDLLQAQSAYAKEQKEKAALEAVAAKSDEYSAIVLTYFKDGACTELKDELKSKTDAELREKMTTDGLPEMVQDVVIRIKNKWSDELDPKMSERFRVQNYKIYNRSSYKNDWVATQMSDQNNPTGIWTNSLQLMYVFVEGDIPAGTSLRIASSDGAEITRVWCDNGVELKKGLNILYCGTDYAYQWIMYTANTTNYQKKLSEYPDIKIHIEGGYALGYANVAGLDETAANAEYESTFKYAKQLLKQQNTDQTKINWAVKGERGIFIFPVECYDQIWSDRAWNGKVYGYKIYKSMYFYDSVLKWEWSCMGFQDRVEAGEADNNLENLAAGFGDAVYPTYINCLAPAMMLYKGKNPYSSDGYTCMPSIGAVESSYNAERADFDTWCVGHESGHNNQHTINLPSSMESSNNLFSNIITYQWGYRMSRGWSFNENMPYTKTKTIFPRRDISVTLRMYYNLYLYYHRAQHDRGFLQKLHKSLRADRMSFGGDGYWNGPEGGANMGKATNSWLKFYEKVCDAAQEDLTEYFRMWGFFYPTDKCESAIKNPNNGKWYVYCGDYSSYYIECTQQMIDEAIARVKAKNYPENKQICFVEDRLILQKRTDLLAGKDNGLTYKPDNSGRSRTAEQLKAEYGNIGYVDYYKEGQHKVAKAEDYSYIKTGGNIKIKVKDGAEDNGVGIIVYNEQGDIVWMSNTFEFTMPTEYGAGNIAVKIINADGTEVQIIDAIDSNDPATLKEVLQAAVNATTAYTSLSDDKGVKVGYYPAEELKTLIDLVGQANTALKNNTTDQYKSLAQSLNNEMVNIDANASVTKIEPNGIYTLQNFSRNRYLTTSTSTQTTAGTAGQWSFVPTDQEGIYYLQNRDSKKYISNVGDNGKFAVAATSQADAIKFALPLYQTGAYLLQMKSGDTAGKCVNNTPSNEGIISWSGDAGSAWMITRVDYIEDIDITTIQDLIKKSEALVDQVSVYDESFSPFTLQNTDKTAAYYIWSNETATADHGIDKLIDASTVSYYQGENAAEGQSPALYVYMQNRVKAFQFALRYAGSNKPNTIKVYAGNSETTFATLIGTFSANTSKTTFSADVKTTSSMGNKYFKFEFSGIDNPASGYANAIRLADFSLKNSEVSITLKEPYTGMKSGTKTGEDLIKAVKDAEAAAENAIKGEVTMLTLESPYNTLLKAYNALQAAAEACTPTAIVDIEATQNVTKAIVDLSGRRISKITKPGIYVINGKKILVK